MSRARVVAILVFFAVFAAGCSRTSSQPPGKDAIPGAPVNTEGRSESVSDAGGPGASGARDEPSLVKQTTMDGWLWTENLQQSISPRGDYALMVRKAASGDAVIAAPLAAGDDEIITLDTMDTEWVREHSPEYHPEHYPLGWIDDTRCLFAVYGHQSTGPHKGERGVSIRVGDVTRASSTETAFIPLAEGAFKSGRLIVGKGKAYLHVTAAIWEYDVEKSALRAVRTGMPTYDGLFWPRLSPDGRYYAYDLHEQRRNGIHVLEADTGTEKPLLLNGETASFYPSWSPDGRYVAAHTSRLRRGASPKPGYTEESEVYNMLPDEDGPQPVSDCITVIRPDGTIVRTIEVKGKMLSRFAWGPRSDVIGFVAGTVARVPGRSQEEQGGLEFVPDSVWIARVAGGEGAESEGAGDEGAGTGDDPVCLANIEPAAPGEDRSVTVAAVEPDGKGVLCLDWRNDAWSLNRLRMGDPPGASLRLDGGIAGGGVCPVFGDSIAALVENTESVGVWVFDPLGAREITRFKPEGSVWVCGYNDDTLVVKCDVEPGEGSVVRMYRMPGR